MTAEIPSAFEVLRRAAAATILLLAVAGAGSAADDALSGDQKRQLSQAVEATRAQEELVGIQVAVHYGDGLAFSMNAGHADLENAVPVTANTRFEIASITKAFTGLGLLLLSERQGIDVDQPVQRYVPGFPEKPKGALTVRMLAGALGGVRHYSETERTPRFYATHYADVADALEIFQDDSLVARPGERVVYSSYGYNLLAAAIQDAAGRPFPDYIQEAILDPLGLKNTGQIDVRFPMADRARMYSFIDPYSRQVSDRLMVVPTMDHSYNAGAGNMYSTAEDLAAFGSRLLEPGFLSQRVYDEVYTPHQTAAGESTWFSDGWVFIAMGANPRSLIAGGAYPGVQAILRVYPDQGLVIALLTNTWGKKGSEGGFTRQLSGDLEKIVLPPDESEN
jgi:CubicO group peptidase (beta-lactamase class C family)